MTPQTAKHLMKSTPSLAPRSARGRRANALLVDDDPDFVALMERALARAGFQVATAPDGPCALELLRNHPVDIVLLDVVLPGMDGFETCARIRATARGRHVPVLMMTASEDYDAITRAYEAGASDFLTKPINMALLGYRIRYALRAKYTADDLRGHRRRLLAAQRMARLGHWEFNLDSARFLWSAELRSVLGLEGEDPHARLDDLIALVHPDDRQFVETTIDEAITEKSPFSLEHRVVTPRGQVLNVLHEAEPITEDEDGSVSVLGTVQDVSALRRAEERVRVLSSFDTVTGLPNRASLTEAIDRALHDKSIACAVGAILCVGLDHFRHVNEAMGHSVGDELLRRVAARIDCALGARERVQTEMAHEAGIPLLARVGDCEFATCLERAERGDAEAIAMRINAEFERPFYLDDCEIYLSGCVGIALCPTDGRQGETLLKNSQAAANLAMSNGPNTFHHFSPAVNALARERMALHADLRRALGRNEFGLEYQPRVRAADGAFNSMEALLRWRRPDGGLTGPDAFIGYAEDTGIIVAIGDWVLNEAIEQIRRWSESSLCILRVSVNVSSTQLRRPEFVDRLVDRVQLSGIDPTRLELEITESQMMESFDDLSAGLRRLRKLGVKIALDDFGTGHSSLERLMNLPLDVLKIDRSFVRDAADDQQARAVLSTIISLGHLLGLIVVAEGVETEAQSKLLASLGCDQLQGFLICRPNTPEAIEAWSETTETSGLTSVPDPA
ncbi:MAG: putative bifunctional diguanylate cyclase/phosphodiesterase [Gammaproteobacteria bacterium]